MFAPQSELYNHDLSLKPASCVADEPLPFASFENKLNLYGYIAAKCGSPPGQLSNLVKDSVTENKGYHQTLRENHQIITQKRKENNERKYRGLYAKNTFYPCVNR